MDPERAMEGSPKRRGASGGGGRYFGRRMTERVPSVHERNGSQLERARGEGESEGERGNMAAWPIMVKQLCCGIIFTLESNMFPLEIQGTPPWNPRSSLRIGICPSLESNESS